MASHARRGARPLVALAFLCFAVALLPGSAAAAVEGAHGGFNLADGGAVIGLLPRTGVDIGPYAVVTIVLLGVAVAAVIIAGSFRNRI